MPPLAQVTPDTADLERADAGSVLAWAAEHFGVESIVCTASFQNAALVHLVATHAPGVEVVLIDTDYLFDETWAFVEQLRSLYDFPFRVVRPAPGVERDGLWERDADACCQIRKVEPLERALAGKSAWITGVRRAEASTRTHTPVVTFDLKRNVTKVNPMAAWSHEDHDAYLLQHGLPQHPLAAQGYASLGCWPCTRAVAPGEDRRAGRWAGQAKLECGLHL